MKILIVSFFLCQFIVDRAFGEGPPDISETSHLALNITEAQSLQLSRSHRLELTPEQSKLVRLLHPKFRGVVEVITPLFDDCSCGLGNYGIWKSRLTLALPAEGSWGEYDEWPSLQDNYSSDLFIDLRGQIWLGKKEITAAYLKAMCERVIKEQAEDSSNLKPYLWLARPPRLTDLEEGVFTKAISQLQRDCSQYGVVLVGYGVVSESLSDSR